MDQRKPVLSQKSGLLADMLGIDPRKSDSIPFSVGDVTAGSETELQVAVAGSATTVDLPLSIRSSNYFQNVVHRAAVGTRQADRSHALNIGQSMVASSEISIRLERDHLSIRDGV